MSSNVRSPFHNKKHGVKEDNFISEIPKLIDTGRGIIESLKPKISPEEQAVKANIWYQMLATFVKKSSMTGAELAAQYESRYPLRQKKTKKAVTAQLGNMNREQVINYMVKKVNDERVKGGLSMVTKDQLLAGFGMKKVPVTIEQVITGKKEIPTSPQSSISLPLPDKNLPIQDKRFDVVRPLRGTMEMGLRAKGVSPSGNLEVLTNQFYNEIVRVDQPNNFTGQVELPRVDLYDCTPSHADEAKDAIITAVVTYIQGLKERKAQGGEMSKIQDIIVTGAERTEGIIKDKAKEQAATRVGSEILFGGKWLWIVGGVMGFILLIVILKKTL